jgi:hypothetical protein
LQTEPIPYLTKLKAFCQDQGLEAETRWYGKAIARLSGSTE